MAYKITNTDFFKKRMQDEEQGSPPDTVRRAAAGIPYEGTAQKFKIGGTVGTILADSGKRLRETGFPGMAGELEKCRKSAVHERFTVAVVGEFAKGKSTFLNKLLGREFLPVGDLPTTAVMTRIRHNPKETLIAFDEQDRKIFERELSQESWEGLTAQNFGGEDFRGTALVGIDSEWLRDSDIELVDTPGAGDLSEARARVIGDALLSCDGVVITVSAAAPLSLSEKQFIEERLLARRIPFMLLVITKLDQVSSEERAGVIRYVRDKLKSWNMDIPVYVPYRIELPEAAFDDIVGMDKVKNEILRWAACPERVKLTETWLLGKAADMMKNAVSSLTEKQLLLEETDREKRDAMLSEKKEKLAQAKLVWGELRIQMQKRCTACYRLLTERADDYAENITQRLQYEAGHAGNPQKWWEQDFPYRARSEMAGMAVGIENTVSGRIREDARWYCMSIEKTFRSHILYRQETISDRNTFKEFTPDSHLQFENLDKQRNAFRIGSAVLSISGCALFSALGFLPIVATMGIGTGTSIVSERLLRKKAEEQREELQREIANCIPAFIRKAMFESEDRLEAVYQDLIREAEKSEEAWLEAQKTAIDSAATAVANGQAEVITEELAKLRRQAEAIDTLLQEG